MFRRVALGCYVRGAIALRSPVRPQATTLYKRWMSNDGQDGEGTENAKQQEAKEEEAVLTAAESQQSTDEKANVEKPKKKPLSLADALSADATTKPSVTEIMNIGPKNKQWGPGSNFSLNKGATYGFFKTSEDSEELANPVDAERDIDVNLDMSDDHLDQMIEALYDSSLSVVAAAERITPGTVDAKSDVEPPQSGYESPQEVLSNIVQSKQDTLSPRSEYFATLSATSLARNPELQTFNKRKMMKKILRMTK